MSAYWDFHHSDEYLVEKERMWEFDGLSIQTLMRPIDMSAYSHWTEKGYNDKYHELYRLRLEQIENICNSIIDHMAWYGYNNPDDTKEEDYVDGHDILMLKAMLTNVVKSVESGTYPNRGEMH